MKILHVINNLATGGAEKLLLETIPKYSGTDFTVDVLVLNGVEHPFYLDLEYNHENELFSLGKGSIYNPILIFKAMKYLKKYDIIHVHLFPSLYWMALAKMLRFSSVKLIYTEHSTSNRRHHSFLFRLFDKLIYSQYSKIVCVSKEVEEQLKNKLNLPQSKLITIENGIDLSKIENAKGYTIDELNLSLPSDAKLLLQVSSFQFPKDQITVIKSLQYLPKNVHLLFAGEGNLEAQCKQLVVELQLTKRVHFLGIRMDVPRLLKTADIIVLSSEYEGLSLSCIEGLASGKPFVASDVPGLRDIVANSELLFPFQNEKELAAICTTLLQDKSKYEAAVQMGSERAKKYDITNLIHKQTELYQSFS